MLNGRLLLQGGDRKSIHYPYLIKKHFIKEKENQIKASKQTKKKEKRRKEEEKTPNGNHTKMKVLFCLELKIKCG